MVAGHDDIMAFFVAISQFGVPAACIGTGAFFIWKGLTYSKKDVTDAALGILAPIGLVVAGALFAGAGIWLAFMNIQVSKPLSMH